MENKVDVMVANHTITKSIIIRITKASARPKTLAENLWDSGSFMITREMNMILSNPSTSSSIERMHRDRNPWMENKAPNS